MHDRLDAVRHNPSADAAEIPPPHEGVLRATSVAVRGSYPVHGHTPVPRRCVHGTAQPPRGAVHAVGAGDASADGDWLVPHNLGLPWTEKPPGVQWIYALAIALTGSTSEIAVRLPSVLAGTGLACLVAALAARWFGPLAGLLSGLIQGTMLYTLRLAPLAEVEMHLTLAVAGAMACFLLACVDGPPGRGRSMARWLPWLFYLCLAASCLLKGLVGPCFALGACVAYTLWQRDREGVRFLLNPVGIGLGLVALLAWAVPAYLRCPSYLDDLVLHHFGRMRGELGGGKPLLLSLHDAVCPLAMDPGRRLGRRPGVATRPTAAAVLEVHPVLVGAGALVAVRQRLQEEPLSLAPAATADHPRRVGAKLLRWRLSPAGLAAVRALRGAGHAGLPHRRRGHHPWPVPGSFGPCAPRRDHRNGPLASIGFENLGHGRAYLISFFCLIWLAAAWCYVTILPQHNSYREQTQFAQRINAWLPDGSPLFSLGVWQEQVFYYIQSRRSTCRRPT